MPDSVSVQTVVEAIAPLKFHTMGHSEHQDQSGG